MARRLAAIMAADVVGYSKLMAEDEVATHAALKSHRRELFDPEIARHGGRIVKLMGDGALVEFPSVVEAVECAVAIQSGLANGNGKIKLRIGINLGDVIIDGDDIYGDGVNVAARLEALAEQGGICIHRNVRDQLRGKLDIDFEDMGEVEVKNIDRPVRAFRVVQNDKTRAIAERPAEGRSQAKKVSRFRPAAVGISLSLFILIAGLAWWRLAAPEFEPVAPETMAQPLPDKPSIAVLAFNDLSTGADKDYLSDAISEGIITELSRFPELFVIARNSSFHYRGKPVDVRDIARQLGVRFVLEGSQQKSGNKLRVTVQLIDAVAGNHVWAETHDGDLADIFTVQDKITRAVAAAAGAKLLLMASQEAARAEPARLTAFEHWLRGNRYRNQFTREGNEQARQEYLAAVNAAPRLTLGHIGLAYVYVSSFRWNWPGIEREKLLPMARQEAQTALNLAPDDYAAHLAMAYVLMQAGEIDAAVVKLREALKLNPNSADVRASLAEALDYTGQVPESIDFMQEAMRLDPHHPDWYEWVLAWSQWYVGDCAEGLATMARMVNMPNLSRRTLASLHVCLGQIDKARAVIAEFLRQEPGYTIADVRLSLAQKYQNPADLERWIDDLRKAGLPD